MDSKLTFSSRICRRRLSRSSSACRDLEVAEAAADHGIGLVLEDLPELEVPVQSQLEEKFGLEPLPELHRVRLRRVEENGEFPIQLPLQGVLEKPDDFLLLGRREQVRLGEQEDDPRGVLRQFADELHVVIRKRPVGAHRQDGGAHLGQPVGRHLHVGFEDASQAGGVDEPQPRVIGQGWQLDVNRLHVLLVRGVFRLGGVLVESAHGDLLRRAVVEGDEGPFPLAEPQAGDDRRDGDDSHGQDVPPDEVVDERTLAGLELAEDGHVDGRVLDEEPLAGVELSVEREDLHPVADGTDSLQCSLRDVLDGGRRHG
ncbi:MAG: hypothetical protein MUE57_06260, partial [Syntrophales bacterium]|nr:hypothetical protein [Syntrophales bacterium]